MAESTPRRQVFPSGMFRDTDGGKPRFDLLVPRCLSYAEQPLTRLAVHFAHGAAKYADRNFELAAGQDDLDRVLSSAGRHYHQWMSGEVDEDHASALVFNVWQAEMIRRKMERR